MKTYYCVECGLVEVDKPNKKCDACYQREQKRERNKKHSWMWRGWTRQDERNELESHGRNGS